jgi:hypothetical protein
MPLRTGRRGTGAPNALLVVAQIVPTQSASINTRVQAYSSANPDYATALMTDRLHPNEAGCMVMATTWYDGIKSYLP